MNTPYTADHLLEADLASALRIQHPTDRRAAIDRAITNCQNRRHHKERQERREQTAVYGHTAYTPQQPPDKKDMPQSPIPTACGGDAQDNNLTPEKSALHTPGKTVSL